MKRWIALLLFVLLAMAPFSASMAASPDSVYIDGVELKFGTPYYVNGDVAARFADPGNWNAYYDKATGVLTLKNLTVTGSQAVVTYGTERYVCGIYVPAGDLTINLIGDNKVSTAASNLFNVFAARINGAITIQGTGTLTAIAGKAEAPNPSTIISSYGIMANSLTQKGGTVKAVGGEATRGSSYGVHVSSNVTVSGGSLNGEGGSSSVGESAGVFSNAGIVVNGGSLTGVGGRIVSGDRTSTGVYALGSYSITDGRLAAKADTGGKAKALIKAPAPLPDAYYWRTGESAGYTQYPPTGYTWEATQTYVDIRTSLPPADVTGGAGDGVPETGDSATPVLWLGIALLASAGLTVSAVRRRKRQNG